MAQSKGDPAGSPFFIKTLEGENMEKKYTFLTDVTNAGGTLIKDHGPIIERGSVYSLDPESDSVKWLESSKAIESAPGNAFLDQNAEKSIGAIKAEDLDLEQLQDLLAYEEENKKRSSVIKVIQEKIETVQEG